MGILKLFKKNTVQEPVVFVPEKEERVSYLDFMAKLGRFVKPNQTNVDDAIKKLLPRGWQDFKPISAVSGTAMDACAIKPAMYENDLPMEMLPFFTHTFIGWQACALLYENAYIKKACEIPARDAVAVDYKLQYENKDGDEDDSTDKEEELELLNRLKKRSDKEMRIKDVVRDAEIFKNVYGQILVVPTFNIDVDMSKEFSPKAVKKGSYTGMTIIQPFWVTYQLSADGVANPQMAGYYDPEYYIINGNKKIHKSWVIKTVNGACPDILKPVYYYGGIPLTQQIYERVFCAEKTANEAPKLALTKRLLIVDGNINNMSANPQEAYNTLQNVLELRDNMGLMVKNPGDQVQQIDTSLADMDALIMTQFQLVAAIAEMPVTKLLKTQLRGLSNTGEYESKDYNQKLVEIQENVYDRILERHYLLLSLSEHGKDLGLQIVWNPIDTPTEKEIAEIEQIQANTDSTYIAAGVVDASEVRNSLRSNEDSRFHNLSEEVPELEESLLDDEETAENNDADTDEDK